MSAAVGKKPKKTKPILTKAQQAAEEKRREMQRAKQKEALAARAQGMEYVSIAKKRKPLERRKELKRKAERALERNSARRSAQKAAKVAKATAPDVIVIPIFWKGQAGQMGQVLSVCSDAEEALKGDGWNVQLDAGHKYTPGQKYAHWEHRGVRLRIEVGPQEASRGNCTVALTRAPGVPAERVNGVAVSADTLPARLAELRAQLVTEPEPGASSAGMGAQEEQEQEELEEPKKTAEEHPAGAAPFGDGVLALRSEVKRGGGDDLEDDFDLGHDSDSMPAPPPKKKKKKVEVGTEPSGESSKAQKKPKAAKGPKAVSF